MTVELERFTYEKFLTEYREEDARFLHATCQQLARVTDEDKRNRIGWEVLTERWPNEDDFIQNVFRIRTKKPGYTPLLRYNQAQVKLTGRVRGQQRDGNPIRIIILKARQTGFSTVVQAYENIRAYRTPNRRTACIADERRRAEEIFRMGTFFREGMLFPPKLAAQRRAEIETEEGSLYTVMTANNLESGRGITAHDVHASEFAYWLNGEVVMGGILNALSDDPDTMLIIESTANGMSNLYYEMWKMAEDGTASDWIPVFMPWWSHAAYSKPLTVDQAHRLLDSLSPEEQEYRKMFNLSAGQLAWRRWAIANKCQNSPMLFKQEYPAFPEEAFLYTGSPVFDLKRLTALERECVPPKIRADLVIL